MGEAALPPLIGVAALMRRAFAGEDLAPLGQVLLARAGADPQDAHAWLDLSTVLQLTGHRANALAVQAEAIAIAPQYTLPAHGVGAGLSLLVLMGPGDLMANTPVEFLVDDADVTLHLLYLTLESAWPEVIPEHDLMLVAVAESDGNQALLQRLSQDIAEWPRPVLNRPERIAVLSRDGACAALQGIEGVSMPVTVRVDRTQLEKVANGSSTLRSLLIEGDFPVIVRPLGSHAGQQLDKIDSRDALSQYLKKVDSDRLYLARFVDYRSPDGQYRKYRITLVDGQPYICHFAVSSHWMIHYLNAGMSDSAEKRAEEAATMAHFSQQFALRHAAALQAIDQRIGLPYVGIDCAETADGQLLIFEIDNAMIVHDMDPEHLFAYKKPVMRKLFAAFRALLERNRHVTSS